MADMYDLAAQAESRALGGKTAPTVDPYQAAADAEAQQNQLRTRAVFERALTVNPDQAAQSKKLMATTGLPLSVIERNLDEVKRKEQARALDLVRMAQDSPVLARQMMDPTFTNQAHDDVSTLASIETGVAKAVRYMMGATPSGGVVGDLQAGVLNSAASLAGGKRAVLDTLEPFLRAATGDSNNRLAQMSQEYAQQAKAWRDAAAKLSPQTGDMVGDGVSSGVQSFVQNAKYLPLALAGPVGAATALYGMVSEAFGSSYNKAADKGLPLWQSLGYAGADAAVEYWTEKMPLDALIGGIAKNAGFIKTVAKSMALEIPGEQVATILQDLNEWATINPGRPFADYLAERPSAAVQTLIATVIGTGGNVAVVHGIAKATDQIAGAAWRNDLVDQQAELLKEQLRLATNSMLRQRNPEEFRAIVQAMAEQTDGAPQAVYVDAEVLAQMPQDVLNQLPGVADQMEEALASGDVVAIKMADVLTVAPGTPLEQLLVEHGRVGDPLAMSQFEAKAAGEQAQVFLQKQTEAVIKQANDSQAMQESYDRVRQGVLDQLTTTKRFRKDVNEGYATWVASFYTTMAGRLGVTPEQFRDGGWTDKQGNVQPPRRLNIVDKTGAGESLNAKGSQLDTPEFRNWFGDSKAVEMVGGTGSKDAVFAPMRLFHTTRNGDFTAFEAGRTTVNSTTFGDVETTRAAIFFTPSVEDSNAYGKLSDGRVVKGAATIPVYLKTENPLDLTEGIKEGVAEALAATGFVSERFVYNSMPHWEMFDGENGKAVVDAARAAGYDSIIFNDVNPITGDTFEAWAVFDPTQIKSAIGNSGAFSPTDANILKQSMSSRLPSAMKATEDPLAAVLNITFDTVVSDEKTLAKNVAALQALPNTRKLKGKGAKDPVRNVEAFIDHVVSNLLWLHDHMPQDMRERARLWYDGGRKTIEAWGKRYGISEMQGAAAIAVLSPQNGWFANVSQAERIADMVFGLRDFAWDDKMTAEATRISGEDGPDARMQAAIGKTLGELLATPDIAARWARVYDQTYNNRAYKVLTPEGGAADYVKTNAGNDATMMWKSYATIGKAISVLMDGRAENVYYQLGKEHKVRNFYNNLFAPNSELGYATIDTHAVAAALLRPLASADIEVAQAFGGGGSASSAFTGLNGTYPIYLEAYRRAAEARGIQPRQMQSITWEAVRGLFEAAKKSGLKTRANAIWERYKAGEIEQDQAQKEILELAGDITPPSWTEVPFNDTPGRTYEGPAQKVIDARGDIGASATPAAKVMFEVAPDPNDVALTAEWNALSPADRLALSQGVAAQIVPEVLKELGTDGSFVMQIGGYLGATNPSMTLQVARPELAVQAAKLLGHALAQDSMVVITDEQVVGTEPTGVVTITLPDGWGDTQITELYNRLWALERNGTHLAGGHTTADGQMSILNFSGLPDEEFAQAIDDHLAGEFPISIDTVYSAFPEKKDYGYGSDGSEGADAPGKSPAQRRPDSFRAEATRSLRDALNARGGAPGGLFFQAQRAGPGRTDVNDGPDGRSANPHAVDLVGTHFSTGQRTRLDGRYFGTGLKGAEQTRLKESTDPRIRERVYFYIDEGAGVRPEAGVGGYAHEVPITNLYNTQGDPLKLFKSGDLNGSESRVLDAGYDGYYFPAYANQQGIAIVMGAASRGMAATPVANPTREAPDLTPPKPYKRGLMSREINALDMAPVQAAAPSAKLLAGTFQVDQAEFPKAQAAMRAQGVELPEVFAQPARGTFNPKTLELALNENADLSTFFHETGHFFLEVMADLAAQPGAPAEVAADMGVILKWFGVPDLATWQGYTLEQQRPYHERFAESIEQYILEGKAPSVELQPAFRRFKSWMLSVYQNIKSFIASRGGKTDIQLSDDVRKVFDRMLASEEQIKNAEEVAGLLPDMDATPDAVERLTARSIRDLKWAVNARSKMIKAMQAQAAKLRKEVEAEVTAEVDEMPEFLAKDALDKLREATPEYKDQLKDWGDRRDAAQERASEEVKAELLAANPEVKGLAKGQLLAKNKKVLANQAQARVIEWEKANPKPVKPVPTNADAQMESIAAKYNFTSVDEMLQAIDLAGDKKATIEGMTDQRMLERHGDLVDQRAIEEAATAAVHSEARAKSLATELAAQSEMLNPRQDTGKTVKTGPNKGSKVTVNAIVQAAKIFAANIVARTTVRDLQSRARQHLAAEARAGKRWQEATAKADTQAAVKAKQDQVLNNAAAKAALEAKGDVDKTIDYLRKFDKESVRKNLPPEYLDQIDKLLEALDLRKSTTGTDIDKRASLRKWVESQHAMGLDPTLPDELLDGMALTSYKELTVEAITGMVDVIKNIEHLGRLKSKLLAAKDQREFDVIAEEVAASIRENGGTELPVRLEPDGRLKQFFKGAWVDHRKLNSLIYQMDGGKENGPFYRALVRSMNDAGTAENVMLEKATEALAKIYAPIEALPGGVSGGKLFIPEIKASLSRAGRLSVALNWGNAQNRQRLMDGDNWTEAQVKAILRTLTPEELKFINDMWEHIDSYWPEIKAKQLRVSGVVEEKVEAEPFELEVGVGTAQHTVQMRGGYYPIKYDPDRSVRAERNEAKEAALQILRGAMARPTTRRGHTKARVDEVKGRPLKKDLSVITQHINQVVHDLAWHEWFIDANRLFNDKRIVGAIREHYGPEVHRALQDTAEAIAVGDTVHQGEIDKLLLMMRSNVTRSIMGASLTTALLQPFGLTQSMARIGVVPVLKGAARWAGDAARMESTVKWISEKSDFMRLRSKTFNRELREISQRVRGKSKLMQVVDASLFALMQKMQMVADVPTWIGAYEKALAGGVDESAAVALADEAVLASQGGGTTKDLAAVQRNMPFLTQFYSYFNTTMNLVVETTAATNFKQPAAVAGWLGDMVLLTVIPAILPALITYLLKGGDEDDPEKLAKKLLEWQASYMLGMFVGLRELPALWSPFDYAGPPAGKLVNDGKRLVQQAGQGEIDDAAVLATIGFLGTALGIPTTQMIRSYKGWKAWDEGDAPATSILFGPPPKD